jgi:DNA-damage-inducible protein J
MAQTNINIRMDQILKAQFETFCSDVGLSMSAAFTVFAKAVILHNRIPFEITNENGKELMREGFIVPKGEENDPFWSEPNLKAVKEGIRQIEEGKAVEKTWAELEAME